MVSSTSRRITIKQHRTPRTPTSTHRNADFPLGRTMDVVYEQARSHFDATNQPGRVCCFFYYLTEGFGSGRGETGGWLPHCQRTLVVLSSVLVGMCTEAVDVGWTVYPVFTARWLWALVSTCEVSSVLAWVINKYGRLNRYFRTSYLGGTGMRVYRRSRVTGGFTPLSGM